MLCLNLGCTGVNCFNLAPSSLDGSGFGTVGIFRESTPGKSRGRAGLTDYDCYLPRFYVPDMNCFSWGGIL